MGDVVQFRKSETKGNGDTWARKVKTIWPPDAIQYAMNDDTAPCELNPDPFEEDMNGSARESAA